MTHIKLEHIDNLRRGKKSWAKIGSRAVPHHLYQYEEEKLKRAMKYKYLEISNKERQNLVNIWEKVCLVKKWDVIIVQVETSKLRAILKKNNTLIMSGTKKEVKNYLKNYV